MLTHPTNPSDLELKSAIGNVEDGQQPIISVTGQGEVLFHSCDSGIADIGSVQIGQQDCTALFSIGQRVRQKT